MAAMTKHKNSLPGDIRLSLCLRAPYCPVYLCLSLTDRVDISDTLMYVYEMLGAELLSNLYDKLGRLLTNPDQSTSWQVSRPQHL